MADEGSNILKGIQDETTRQNQLLGEIKDELKTAATDRKRQAVKDEADTEYAKTQQGQEIAVSKSTEFWQDKTNREIVKQVGARLATKDATEKTAENTADQASEAEKLIDGLIGIDATIEEIMADNQRFQAESFINFAQQRAENIVNMSQTSNLWGALKADMNMIGGKLQLLTQLPGMQSIFTFIKVLLGKLALFIYKSFGGGGLVQSMADGIWEMVNAFREAMGQETLGKPEWMKSEDEKAVERGEKVVSKSGKFYDADSTQADMILTRGGTDQSGSIIDEQMSGNYFKGGSGTKAGDLGAQLGKTMAKIRTTIGTVFTAVMTFFTGLATMIAGWATKALGVISTVITTISSTIMKFILMPMYKAFLWLGRQLWALMAPFWTAMIAFITGLWAMIAPAIIAAAPIIGLILLFVIVAVGMYLLIKYLMANWDIVKERFSIAFEQLSIWASTAGLFISNLIAPIRDGIAMFFAYIQDGIAFLVNGVIDMVNDLAQWIPGWDGIDESNKWSTGNVEAAGAAAAARQDERVSKADEIAGRQSALDARKEALADGRILGAEGGKGDTKAAVTQVTNNNAGKSYVAVSGSPSDKFATAMATSR